MRRVRPSGLSYERYGIDLLETRQMLAVTPASDFTYRTANNQVAITAYVGSASAVEIPATINSLPVTSIGANAFAGKSLTSVILPSSVTSIGGYAFWECTSLTSVTIPSQVTTIGDYSFMYCKSLASVTIPSSVTSIGRAVFSGCGSLTSISVAVDNAAYTSRDGVLYTKDGKTLLEWPAGEAGSVTIPAGVTSIGSDAFNGCTSLTSVTLPTSVTSIGSYAFWECTSLTSMTIPSSVTSIGGGAFSGCGGLTSISVSADNAAYTTRDGVLYTKDGKTLVQWPAGETGNVTIPSGVNTIGACAFQGCKSLTSVTLPTSVTSIGSYAFWECTSLTSMTIPSSVTSIGSGAFSGCGGLTSISVSADNAAYTTRDGVLYTKDGKSLIAVPALKTGAIAIPSGVTTVSYGAFYGCKSLTRVAIPSSVTSIGDRAFWKCTSLTSMTIPSSVTSMGQQAFIRCTSLTSIYFLGNAPSGVSASSIPGTATIYYLDGSAGWASNIGGVTAIQVNYESDGFKWSVANDEITITGYTSSSTAAVIPSTIFGLPVTKIGDGAFAQCLNLTRVTLSTSVAVIGSNAFMYCTSLTGLTIPSSVVSLGDRAFYGCSSLASVVMSPGVTSIGSEAFAFCDSLVNLFVPSTVQHFGEYAVDGLSLKGIYFYGNAPQVPPNASFDWDGVTVYYLPGTSGWTSQFQGVDTTVFPDSMAPTAVAGVRGNGQVQLSWTAPVSNGGSAVTDYTIQYSSNSGASWQTFSHAASSATSATLTGLANGTAYLFRVASVNDVGTGVFTATSSSITPNAVPLPPINIVATRGRGIVIVSWTAPVFTGGVRITDYRVQQSTNGGLSWVTVRDGVSVNTRTVVSGLVMGRDYIFRVASVGRSGAGDSSSPSRVVVPATVPSVPVGLLATGGTGRVALSWRAPTSTGGSPINQYIVQYSPSAGRWLTSTTVGSNTTTAIVGGLLANRSYSFRVLAVNDMGNSSASRVVVAKTLRASPTLVQA